MKRIILALILINTSLVYSQKFKIGPELGVNIIKVETNPIGDSYQLGWHTGISAQYNLKRWLGITTGLFYTQKKHAFQESETIPNLLSSLLGSQGIDGIDMNTYSETNGRVSLNYVQLPISAKYIYNNFSFSLGAYFGYMFNSRTRTNEKRNTPFISTIDINALDPTGLGLATLFLPPASDEIFKESTSNSGLSSFDFGLKTGLSYQVNNLSFNISYLYGFKEYSATKSGTINGNNSYFQVSTNYFFDKFKSNKIHHSKL